MTAKMNKGNVWKAIFRYSLIVLGCAVLAFGDAAFISPANLVTGGVISAGVIIQQFVPGTPIVDYVTWALQIILLIVSFIFLGKAFTMRTLFATLAYPAIFSIFYRIPLSSGYGIGETFFRLMIQTSPEGMLTTSAYLVAAIFGGFFVGFGVVISYIAGGSTGGLDVLAVLFAKRTPVKEGAWSFIIDASLIVTGMIVTHNIMNCLCGIVTAFIAAAVIQVLYVNQRNFVIIDVITSKYEEIQKYVHETMDHASTVIEVVGGYSKERKVMLRVAVRRGEVAALRDVIAHIDSKAWVTFTNASIINGEGFVPLKERTPISKTMDNLNDEGH